MKKKKMRTKIIAFAVAVLMTTASVVAIMNTEYAVENNEKSTKKVVKPGQVKNLKKVNVKTYSDKYGRNVSSAQIKFTKVKGATGYQVLVYRNKTKGLKTPLTWAITTKKSNYTIKNLVPGVRYTIKVRAYKKDQNGTIVYGKIKSLKFTTHGDRKGCYYVCNTCGVSVPGSDKLLTKHGTDVYKIHHEIHAGFTFYMR